MMADDTSLFLSDVESLLNAIDRFNHFETCSGLRLNLSKTELIPIGINDKVDIALPNGVNQIKVSHLPFKALGIWFSKNEKEILELNINDRIKTMERLMNM